VPKNVKFLPFASFWGTKQITFGLYPTVVHGRFTSVQTVQWIGPHKFRGPTFW